MDGIKTILTLIAVIIGALVLLAGIGLIYNLLSYGLILAVLCVGGYVAYRLFARSEPEPEPKQIRPPDAKRELEKVQRLLDQYKRQDR